MKTQKVLPPNEPLLEGGNVPIRSTWWRFFKNQRDDVVDATGFALAGLATRGPDLLQVINTVQAEAFGLIPHQITIAQNTGTWTPADNSGAGLSFTSVSAGFTQLGNMVFAYFTLTYPNTADGSAASIKGLPYQVPNVNYAQVPSIVTSGATIGGEVIALPVKNSFGLTFMTGNPTVTVVNSTLSQFKVSANVIYPVS